jgi:hypothetical protein
VWSSSSAFSEGAAPLGNATQNIVNARDVAVCRRLHTVAMMVEGRTRRIDLNQRLSTPSFLLATVFDTLTGADNPP